MDTHGPPDFKSPLDKASFDQMTEEGEEEDLPTPRFWTPGEPKDLAIKKEEKEKNKAFRAKKERDVAAT